MACYRRGNRLLCLYGAAGAAARRVKGTRQSCRTLERTMNIHTETKGDKLVITVDVSKAVFDAASPSKSGKTKVLASTQGNIPVPCPSAPTGVIKLGINAFF